MIFAELRGKLGSDYSRAHTRAEDLLTSTVFGLLRYLPIDDGIIAVLQRARAIVMDGDRTRAEADRHWMPLDGVARVDYQVWPSFVPFGEPDVLLRLYSRQDLLMSTVLIEAKLYSPKSGGAEVDEEAPDPESPDPDQLVKYWQGLQRRAPRHGLDSSYLLYLTAHSVPPLRELEAALRRMPMMRLGWLSWYDVHSVVDAVDSLPARDLAALLRHKELALFSGFTIVPVPVNLQSRFWGAAQESRVDARWFAGPAPSVPASMRFRRD